MIQINAEMIAALDDVGERTGVAISADGTSLTVAGKAIDLPATDDAWDNLRIRHALPYAARGDRREKLLYTIVQDAGPERPARHLDEELRADLEKLLDVPGALSTDLVADAMRQQYWAQPSERPFLLPYAAELPAGYDHSVLVRSSRGADLERDGKHFRAARYRMFGGYILPFLCWDGHAVDETAIADLLEVLSSDEGFTLLDDLFLAAAETLEPEPARLDPQRLINRANSERHLDALRPENGGPFCQPALDLFRRDLATVVSMRLPRVDRIAALTQVLSLHLATYYYRIALVLSLDLDYLAAAISGEAGAPGCRCGSLAGCPLAGVIKVRAPSLAFRPIAQTAPARQSYLALDRDRLLALPANIITANLLERIFASLTGEQGQAGTPRPARIAAASAANGALAKEMDAAAGALALLYAARPKVSAGSPRRIARRSPGPFALQSTVLQARRSRLKHTSRDVVNQLAYRPGEGSLLRKNGSLYYFELDEDMLALLVRLVCRDSTLPLDEFLQGLTEYGIAPQDPQEVTVLAARLEELGMLDRYSDAGESSFVRHIF